MDETKTKILDQCMDFLDMWLENKTPYFDGVFKGASAIAYYVFTKEEFEEFIQMVAERESRENKS